MVIFLLLSQFRHPQQVKNQHLTVQNKRRRLEWCSSMLERLGETKRLWEVSRKTRNSFRASNDLFCKVSCGFSQRVSRRFSRCFGCLQFPEMCFTSPHPLRRCVGKQTRAAPEMQLRDVVWSDESFFRLREQPNRQNTRICWGQPYLAIVLAHVFLSQSSARAQHCHPSLQLNVESGFRHIF